MIEISLKCEGKSLFEYYATVIPRANDLMDLDVDDDKGKYRVREVTHRVFRAKDGSIATFVKVDVIRMTFQD